MLSNSNVTSARHYHCVHVYAFAIVCCACVRNARPTLSSTPHARMLFLLHHNTRVVLVLHPVSSAVSSHVVGVHNAPAAAPQAVCRYRERF